MNSIVYLVGTLYSNFDIHEKVLEITMITNKIQFMILKRNISFGYEESFVDGLKYNKKKETKFIIHITEIFILFSGNVLLRSLFFVQEYHL